jgi:hypothetical protein
MLAHRSGVSTASTLSQISLPVRARSLSTVVHLGCLLSTRVAVRNFESPPPERKAHSYRLVKSRGFYLG